MFNSKSTGFFGPDKALGGGGLGFPPLSVKFDTDM